MRKLEDGSIEVDSAYMANRLAIANGFNREVNEIQFGLSLDDKPTLAASNEATFFDKSLTDFSLTAEAMRAKLRFRNGPLPPEDSWYRKDWKPPERWLDSGQTPPGSWQEQTIVIGPERAQVIEMVLDGIVKGVNFRELRNSPGLEDFRTDLPNSSPVSERLRISKGEAEFILGVLNGHTDIVDIEGIEVKQAA